MKPEKKPLGLYIHIPFCKQKCTYCDFYSLPDSEAQLRQLGDPDLAGQSRYLARKDFPLYANTQSDYYALGDDNQHHFFKTLKEHTNFLASQERYKTSG